MRYFALVIAIAFALCACGGGGSASKGINPPDLGTETPDPPTPAPGTAPTVATVSGVSDQQQVSGAVALSATGSANTARMILQVNGQREQAQEGASLSCEWDTTALVNGWYLLEVFAEGASQVGSRRLVARVQNEQATAPAFERADSSGASAPPIDWADVTKGALSLVADKESQVSQTICELPTSPRVIVSGVRPGETLSRTVYVSALGTDDVGVRYLALRVGGKLIAETDGFSLSCWLDTTQLPDGPTNLEFDARDEGSYLFHYAIPCTIDNSVDKSGPDVRLVTKGYDSQYTPPVTLEFSVTDQTGIRSIDFTSEGTTLEHFFTDKRPKQQTLSFAVPLPGGDPRYNRYRKISWVAVDTAGRRSEGSKEIYFRTDSYIYGAIRAANGRPAGPDALVDYLGPDKLDIPDYEADRVRRTNVFGDLGYTWYVRFSLGQHRFHASKDGYSADFTVTTTADPASAHLPVNQGMFSGKLAGSRYTEELGVVTGSEDNIPFVLEQLNMSIWPYAWDAPVRMDKVHLIDGEGTGLAEHTLEQLLGDTQLLCGYRTLLVESGADESVLDDAALRANLRQWVLDGGKLYCSGKAYDFVEQLFPEQVDWAGDSGDGLSAVPESHDAAQQGPRRERIEMTSEHPELRDVDPGHPYRKYLRQGSLNRYVRRSNGRDVYDGYQGTVYPLLKIGGWAEGWPVIDSYSDEVTIDGWDGAYDDLNAQPVAFHFFASLGLVAYTSYIASDGVTDDVIPSHQDKALKYYLSYWE